GNHEQAAAVLHEIDNGRFLSTGKQRVGFIDHKHAVVAQILRVAGVAVGDGRAGGQRLHGVAKLHQRHGPGREGAGPVRFGGAAGDAALGRRGRAHYGAIVAVGHPVGVASRFGVAAIEEEFLAA
nr:hypothetical protein [Tanacetum cinerariifolium]